ncbi:MAG TPA: HAMP domain-containing sensor histidine kinase [Planctomycetota bacterium]|nr:HAMP domain-containing sensor histidine kinase [Planctomycetota bacterium]HRR82481.1 HAMP domain-containing sensor histidine kinase [Planctomycetota bacterium]HRT94297.1 HAMP domain-containing sensor histidine kinase [Planctomycetota bacterium]
MTAPSSDARVSYELPLVADGGPAARSDERACLPESLLLRHVMWVCRLRWIVVAILGVFGALGLALGSLAERLGLRPQGSWPLAAAAVLALANLAFVAHARRTARSPGSRGARTNLWSQIAVDLPVLTVVVHQMGSLETYVPFAYLFHIVLACIFFPRSWSLAVTAVACGLYIACVTLEEAGILPAAGLYADASLRGLLDNLPHVRLFNVGWAVLTWLVVWYLASSLSAMVQQRDHELAETNRRLVVAQQERMQHMLRTTHELKAPFSAIHANVQLLLRGYCGEMTPAARDVLSRVSRRCQRLASEIKEMLQLANLESKAQEPLPCADLDLAEVIAACIEQVGPIVAERQVTIEADLQPARTTAAEEHLQMLFGNLLANAVAYSHPGGPVRIECRPLGNGGAQVVVEDHGIGIRPEKLARVFEPYYRTDEAVRHNRESTGLGLAIVRTVAQTYGIRLRIESAPGEGTRCVLAFPPTGRRLAPSRERKESDHGLPADRGR